MLFYSIEYVATHVACGRMDIWNKGEENESSSLSGKEGKEGKEAGT